MNEQMRSQNSPQTGSKTKMAEKKDHRIMQVRTVWVHA